MIDPANLLDFSDPKLLKQIMGESLAYWAMSTIDGGWAEGSALLPAVSKLAKGAEPGKGKFVAMIDEAFDWLGTDIVLAHAKNPPGIDQSSDFDFEAFKAKVRAEGLDWAFADLETAESKYGPDQTACWSPFYQPYVAALRNLSFAGAPMIHGLDEHEIDARTEFLRRRSKSRW